MTLIDDLRGTESDELQRIDRFWRAGCYVALGMILRDNPLLRRPLQPADIKARMLGHWGTPIQPS